MAALNQNETHALRKAMAALSILSKPPSEANLTDDERREIGRTASDLVKTVVTMKGYYPK